MGRGRRRVFLLRRGSQWTRWALSTFRIRETIPSARSRPLASYRHSRGWPAAVEPRMGRAVQPDFGVLGGLPWMAVAMLTWQNPGAKRSEELRRMELSPPLPGWPAAVETWMAPGVRPDLPVRQE